MEGSIDRSSRISLRLTAVGVLLVACLVAAALLVAAPARADCPPPYWDPITSRVVYCGGVPGTPGAPADPGGGGPVAPSCGLTDPFTFCIGTQPCYREPLIVPYAGPVGPPPFEGATWHHQVCNAPAGSAGATVTAVWDVLAPPPPTLAEQARQIIRALPLPTGELDTSPVTRSYVRLPTWFGVDGMGGELRGESAFGLVGVAVPRHLEVDTGDGGSVVCAVGPPTATCAHTYARSSRGGPASAAGLPAYGVSALVVWDLRFEQGGVAVQIDGVQTELRSPPMTVALPVLEIQTVVTRS